MFETAQRSAARESREPSEVNLARTIKKQTAKLSSDVFIWIAIVVIAFFTFYFAR